ncbi:DUF1467 family protein [Martelella alba]|uniref:DUF1467 family protein n=1 Tax=Martelella alba TaxID=2590451 RepID=A0A506UJM7_9HYPH|nr:DUF1467 family protein [Martelella alba]TPW33516.1 DUF1467 family protein [Martelella alba]
MSLFSAFAVYFIIWWVVLFAVLPFGLKTQDEAGEVVPGTAESAPHRFRPLRVLGWTSAIAFVIFVVWWMVTVKFGYDFDRFAGLFW